MTIKDIVMPINYFNLDEASSALTGAIYSLATIILIVSIIYEYLNERDIFNPLKRFIVAVILLTIALPVQNFVVSKSFEVSDVLMNSISDPEKLAMINDPSAFMVRLSEVQFANNTKEVTEEEEIEGTDVKATVTTQEISFAGVLFDQLKNIPNILFATITFGFISWCLYSLQASYYILYFTSGALFVVPAILSIFPTFESSMSGAFKSLGTLFVMPIFVALIAAMLSIKMADFGANQTSAGDSIHSVAIVASLCFTLASSIFISAGFLSASGVSQNLGAVGAMASAGILSGATKVGASALRNKDALVSGVKGLGGLLPWAAKPPLNAIRNGGGLIRSGFASGINKASMGTGPLAKVARPLQGLMSKSAELKSKVVSGAKGAKSSMNHHKSYASPMGRAAGLLKAFPKPSAEFKKTNSDMSAMKKSGLKYISPTGTNAPRNITDIMNANSAKPTESVSRGINSLNKSHLLYNNKAGFKFGARSGTSSPSSGSSTLKPRMGALGGPSGKKNSFMKNNSKNYKLNKWEKEFMEKTSGKSSLTPQEKVIQSNIRDVQKYGRKHWENKFVENVGVMKNPTNKQLKVRDSIMSKRK